PLESWALFVIGIYTGLRKGELLGLHWCDVHLDGARPYLAVRFSYDGPPKTKKGRRQVPLLAPAVRAFRELLEARGDAASMTPPKVDSEGRVTWRAPGSLVWPGDDGRRVHDESWDGGWPERRERLGITRPV